MNNLNELIFLTIKNPNSPTWFPILTNQLVNHEWQNLHSSGINQKNYSTELMLDKQNSKSELAISHLAPKGFNTPVYIYSLPDKILSMYADSGFKAYSNEELKRLPVLECLQESLEVLALVPSIYETISSLVTCLHIIRPEDDEFDISYSLPTIPFSIFVSVPSKRMDNDIFRVAEAILHEAMHLQLTLIEKTEPLIIETDETYFSPWKNELRHPRGVLHAIYVFCVIKQFFELLIQNTMLENTTIEYLTRRYNDISEQLMEIKSFTDCTHLTKTGSLLISRLLENLIKHD